MAFGGFVSTVECKNFVYKMNKFTFIFFVLLVLKMLRQNADTDDDDDDDSNVNNNESIYYRKFSRVENPLCLWDNS